MSKTYKMIEKHFEDLKQINSKSQSALNKALDFINKDFTKDRNELKKKLIQQRAEEQELIDNFKKTDNQLTQDINAISPQRTQSSVGLDPNFDRSRGQQMEQIFSDLQKDLVTSVDGHKDKVKRLDQYLQNKRLTEISDQSGQQLSAFKAQQKAVIDRKNKRMTETMDKLQSIRKDIERKLKELEELEEKTSKNIKKVVLQSHEDEKKEKSKEMEKFVDKAKRILKKN